MPVSLTTSFPFDTGVELGFRPASYVADWCPTAAAVQNIVGEERREMVHQHLAAGPLRAPLPPSLLDDHLPPALREDWVALDPVRNSTGEYLPPCGPRAIEVARLALGTTPRLVFSLRACVVDPRSRGWGAPPPPIPWRRVFILVHERHNPLQRTRFRLQSPEQFEPLSLGDLIRVIDSARDPRLGTVPAHLPFPEALVWWRSRNEHDPRALQRFVRVSSVVYPELGAFYRERLRWYVAGRLARRGDRVSYAPPLAQALEAAWRRRG
jgi:hypothetical protein